MRGPGFICLGVSYEGVGTVGISLACSLEPNQVVHPGKRDVPRNFCCQHGINLGKVCKLEQHGGRISLLRFNMLKA